MTYVYDLILNFNSELYEFYEWNKDDYLYHIKKINLIKVSIDTYNDILNKKIKFHDDFLLTIFHKCEYYHNRDIKEIPYAILITDSYRLMGIILNSDGYIIKYSSLLLDEEEDILSISRRLPIIKLTYKIEGNILHDDLTRYEKYIIKYIKKDLNSCYKENNINKLKYLYYEYFNKDGNSLKDMYYKLVNELDNLNEKHYNLYNLIRLSYMKQGINLTK